MSAATVGPFAVATRRPAPSTRSEVVACPHPGRGASAVVGAGRVGERPVEQRRRSAEQPPRALATGDHPRVAHPAGGSVGLAPTPSRALLLGRGRVADDTAGAGAQADMTVVVVVVAGEALRRLGLTRLDQVVAQPDDAGLRTVAVVEDHLGLVDLEGPVDDRELHVVGRDPGHVAGHAHITVGRRVCSRRHRQRGVASDLQLLGERDALLLVDHRLPRRGTGMAAVAAVVVGRRSGSRSVRVATAGRRGGVALGHPGPPGGVVLVGRIGQHDHEPGCVTLCAGIRDRCGRDEAVEPR